MSLINKMLNELEKNKEVDQVRQKILSGVTASVSGQRYEFGKKIAYLVVVVIIVVVIFGIIRGCDKKTAAKPLKNVAVKSQALAATKGKVVIETTKPAFTTLQNIAIKQENSHTNLDFMLSAPVQYHVDRVSEEQLAVTLNGVKINGNMPVALDGSYIASINTAQNADDVVIKLVLLPGTKIDDLQLLDKPQPHLHLAFSNPQLTSTAMSKVPVPITPEEQATQRLNSIRDSLGCGKMQDAITGLYLFIGDYPEHLQAREMLVSLLIKDGRLQKAHNVLASGLKKNPDYLPFVKLEARILAEQGQVNAAVDLLQKNIDSAEAYDTEYLGILAALYQRQGKYMQAAGLYDRLTKIQPQKTAWWVGLGLALESAGKKNAAREAYRLAGHNSDVPPDLGSFLGNKVKE